MNCIHFSFLHSKAPLNTRCSTWHLALDGAGVSYAEGMKKKFMGYMKNESRFWEGIKMGGMETCKLSVHFPSTMPNSTNSSDSNSGTDRTTVGT